MSSRDRQTDRHRSIASRYADRLAVLAYILFVKISAKIKLAPHFIDTV